MVQDKENEKKQRRCGADCKGDRERRACGTLVGPVVGCLPAVDSAGVKVNCEFCSGPKCRRISRVNPRDMSHHNDLNSEG